MQLRARIFITGIVQGVGFRPYLYSLAHTHQLHGWVLNSTDGVHLEVEGAEAGLRRFVEAIRPEAPPLSRIDTVTVDYLEPVGLEDFVIRHSEGDASRYVKISPDVCTCADCLAELNDSADRRYRYPFINCTNCGPRYTIIEDIPYDRPKTTMKTFPMCPRCQAEYEDPGNRRFHAQPNACPDCGPRIWLEGLEESFEQGEALRQTVALLAAGRILAIKGLGGFHLVCDALNEEAVSTLRERKHRVMKPFAVMCADVEQVRHFCLVSEQEAALLESIQRPIVLLDRRDKRMLTTVAPNNRTLGVMLPYTPLHFLLLADATAQGMPMLVMTSANLSEEPIVIGNQEARERLATLADAFLMHDREICTRCDDSVMRVLRLSSESTAGHTMPIRRSRGYAPEPVDLDREMPSILACGGELKNTICLTKENHAFLSQHIGDLENAEAYTYFCDSVEYLSRLFRAHPEIVAHDLHPEYLSTKYALEQADKRIIPVQHHHAHIASCLAEHGVHHPVIGVAFDGTGYGTDGAIWGGEFLWVEGAAFRRLAHLRYVPLPGGDAAVRQVWRMGVSHLYDAYGEGLWDLPLPLVQQLDPVQGRVVFQMIQRRVNAPDTSSVGRLFDAVSAILGICSGTSYEGQAAIELEQESARCSGSSYSWQPTPESVSEGAYPIDTRPLIRAVVEDYLAGEPVPTIAARFHQTLASAIAHICRHLARQHDTRTIVLSGGVFQNRQLLTHTWQSLTDLGLTPLTHSRVPTNDGSLCLGQAWVAAHQDR